MGEREIERERGGGGEREIHRDRDRQTDRQTEKQRYRDSGVTRILQTRPKWGKSSHLC